MRIMCMGLNTSQKQNTFKIVEIYFLSIDNPCSDDYYTGEGGEE